MSKLRKLPTITMVRLAAIISMVVIIGLRLPANLDIINTLSEMPVNLFRGTLAGVIGLTMETVTLLLLAWPRSRAVTMLGLTSLALFCLGFAYWAILLRTAIDGLGFPAEAYVYIVTFSSAFASLLVFMPGLNDVPRHAPNRQQLAKVIPLKGTVYQLNASNGGRHRPEGK